MKYFWVFNLVVLVANAVCGVRFFREEEYMWACANWFACGFNLPIVITAVSIFLRGDDK